MDFKPLILLLIIATCHSSQIDDIRSEFFKIESKIWNEILDEKHLDPTNVQSKNRAGIALIKEFKKFDNLISQHFPHTLEYGLDFLQRLWEWEVIRSYELGNVYNLYETFRRMELRQIDNGLITEDMVWTDFNASVSEFQYVDQLGNRLQEIIFNDQIFENALKEANSDLCNLRQSPQLLIYNLYTTLALTELKGYAMMQFSYMLMKLYAKGNMTREVNLMHEAYETRTDKMVKAVKNVMQNASRELWICDPKRHKAGVTYVEITQLLQGYIENEVDLNKDGTCMETCDSYTYTKTYGCFKDLYCSKQRSCKGKVINCKYYDADMWICPGSSQSGRRYEYIEYENGRTLGHKEYCARGTTKVDSWWRWLFWRCSYCFCLCDEQSPTSDRYFNLRNTQSDYLNNKVITGLRFVKENRIIHLQIQQGELLPKARINEETVEWVPVDSYRVTDNGVYAGDDYHTLSWESRAIDLDEIQAEGNKIITGVRFRKVGTHLNFEIQVCPFNFTTGQLIDPKNTNVWIGNDNTDGDVDNPRRQIRLKDPDVSTRSNSLSAPDSQHNQFIHFTNTDIEKDAAQTTVPFIDAQSVVAQTPVPLNGAGIYHKGQPGYGGFIAPKIITFDYTPYLIRPIDLK